MERILILGASGLVGRAVSKELENTYEVYGTYGNHPIDLTHSINFDMASGPHITKVLNQVKPTKVVYCLRGEYDAQLELLNQLVDYLWPIDGRLYFCSTANVFDGDATKPHSKNDIPLADSDYGQFKIACEKLLINHLNDKGIILRLPMVWGKDSARFKSLIDLLDNRGRVDVYTNLYINNQIDVMLAQQIVHIIRHDLKGIYHLGSSDLISHSEFVKTVVNQLGYLDVSYNEDPPSVEKSYLAVLPTHGDLPKEYDLSNELVIRYLTD